MTSSLEEKDWNLELEAKSNPPAALASRQMLGGGPILVLVLRRNYFLKFYSRTHIQSLAIILGQHFADFHSAVQCGQVEGRPFYEKLKRSPNFLYSLPSEGVSSCQKLLFVHSLFTQLF